MAMEKKGSAKRTGESTVLPERPSNFTRPH